HHRVDRRLDEPARVFMRVAQLLLDPFERGDVAGDASDAGDIARRIADRKHTYQRDPALAVFAARIMLIAGGLAGLQNPAVGFQLHLQLVGRNEDVDAAAERLFGLEPVDPLGRRIPAYNPAVTAGRDHRV